MNSRKFVKMVPLTYATMALLLSGCGKSFYKTTLTPEEKSLICGYSDLSEREECLDESDEQIEWCKEALGQEKDCWNTLLGDQAKFVKHYGVTDKAYFSYLHDPLKLRSLINRITSDQAKKKP